MDFTELVRDIAQRLAAAGRHEPPAVLHSATQLVLGAHLGQPAAHRKMHELGRRWPALCDLFEHVQSLLASHPVARHLGCSQPSTGRSHGGGRGGHGGGGHAHHGHHVRHAEGEDGVLLGGPWWGWAPPELEYVVADDHRDDDEQREFEEAPPIGATTGRCRAASPVVFVPERATGEPLGAPLNAAWAGIEGHGRHYLTEERRRMDQVRPFGDGEPAWPIHWSQRG
jgi:hypothetical protein